MLSLAKYNDELGPIFVSAPVSQVSYNAQKRWDLMHWLKHCSEAAETIGLARTPSQTIIMSCHDDTRLCWECTLGRSLQLQTSQADVLGISVWQQVLDMQGGLNISLSTFSLPLSCAGLMVTFFALFGYPALQTWAGLKLTCSIGLLLAIPGALILPTAYFWMSTPFLKMVSGLAPLSLLFCVVPYPCNHSGLSSVWPLSDKSVACWQAPVVFFTVADTLHL